MFSLEKLALERIISICAADSSLDWQVFQSVSWNYFCWVSTKNAYPYPWRVAKWEFGVGMGWWPILSSVNCSCFDCHRQVSMLRMGRKVVDGALIIGCRTSCLKTLIHNGNGDGPITGHFLIGTHICGRQPIANEKMDRADKKAGTRQTFRGECVVACICLCARRTTAKTCRLTSAQIFASVSQTMFRHRIRMNRKNVVTELWWVWQSCDNVTGFWRKKKPLYTFSSKQLGCEYTHTMLSILENNTWE